MGGLVPHPHSASLARRFSPSSMCGNFGLLLLQQLGHDRCQKLLRALVEQTMVRGAQSAGVCTYGSDGNGSRVRVVNGKRTNLAELLLAKCTRQGFLRSLHPQQIIQGHTRFATSSIANMDGTHPHQWMARSTQPVWSWSEKEQRFLATMRRCLSITTRATTSIVLSVPFLT